jgi:hypothetical protein
MWSFFIVFLLQFFPVNAYYFYVSSWYSGQCDVVPYEIEREPHDQHAAEHFEDRESCCASIPDGCLDDIGECWTVTNYFPRRCEHHAKCPRHDDHYDTQRDCCGGNDETMCELQPNECYVTDSWWNPRSCKMVKTGCDTNGQAYLTMNECCVNSFSHEGCGYDFVSCWIPDWSSTTCHHEAPTS